MALPAPSELVAVLLPLPKGLRALTRILLSLLPYSTVQEIAGRIGVMMSAQLPLHASAIDADSMTAAGRRGIAAQLGAVVVALAAMPGCSRATAGAADDEASAEAATQTAGEVAVLSLIRWIERQFTAEGEQAAAAIRAAVQAAQTP
jgi:hypothetical protein